METAVRILTEAEVEILELWVRAGRVPANISFMDAASIAVEGTLKMVEKLQAQREIVAKASGAENKDK